MLSRTFFQRDPLTCAQELIGCELVWNSCAGLIVETEAYAAVGDEAAHTFTRPSARAFVADHQAGAAYVYFNYGMYWLFNVLMRRRRFPGSAAATPRPVETLCSGPGKLTIALGIDGQHHGLDLCQNPKRGFQIRSAGTPAGCVVSDIRVGISKSAHFPWRFLAPDSAFVSKPPTTR